MLDKQYTNAIDRNLDVETIIEKKAIYAPTMQKEFERSTRLVDGETIEYKNKVNVNRSYGMVGFTNKRIIFLKHYLLQSDKILYIPYTAISKATCYSLKNFLYPEPDVYIELIVDNKKIYFYIADTMQFVLGQNQYKETLEAFNVLRRKLSSNITGSQNGKRSFWKVFLPLF